MSAYAYQRGVPLLPAPLPRRVEAGKDRELMDLQHIVSAAMTPDLQLRLRFADGFEGVADLAPLVAKGGVYVAIADNPTGFTIAPHGRALAWHDADGDEVDLCADALRLMADRKTAAAA